MDERTVLPGWQAPESDDSPVVVHRYRLGLETAVSVRSAGAAWACTPERSAGGTIAAEEWAEAGEGDGAAQAFVDLLRYADLPAVPGFRVVRLAPPPEAQGERGADTDPEGSVHATVVVGERVVVTWTRRTVDAPHPGVLTLQHLAALDFIGAPDVFGVLLWRTPGGHEVPVAVATRYLPRSRDGWQWGPELVEVAAGLRASPVPVGTPPGGMDLSAVELPARLGRLVAKLHLALATPSDVVPRPAAAADPSALRAWHATARAEVDAAARLVLARPAPFARYVDTCELGALAASVDELGALADQVARGSATVRIQLVHGDLHIGRVLRWTRGLSVVGFDAEPPVDPPPERTPTLQPAARDVARLLTSLAEVARRASAHPDVPDGVAWAWHRRAREQVLGAYRAVLEAEGAQGLLDERLLAAFEARERARDVLEAAAADAAVEPA